MPSPDAVLAFLTQVNEQDYVIVTEQPKLDIDLYLQNYTGRTRFDRLIHIGRSSVPLCVEALKDAFKEAKNGQDVSRYKEAWELVRYVAPDEPEFQRDDGWIDSMERTNKAETNRLEMELKGYKNNLIKESIRMGNEDLGRHFEKIGKLALASDTYGRMRQDVSTTKHIVDCSVHMGGIALQRKEWQIALASTTKIGSIQSSDDDKSVQTIIKVMAGIAHIGLGNYLEAAKSFLNADFGVAASAYSHVASPNDIAIYGGLLALATMDRGELQRRVLDNQSFRTFLEHEPHIRKAISLFVNGRYSSCLSILESCRPDYLLDLYLYSHIDKVYRRIRSKCITQYFIPFSVVTLESLDAAFASTGQSVESELIEMIQLGSLKARIDRKNKLLVAVEPDPRAEMQKNALQVAHKYEKEAKERLRRLSLMSAGLEVIGSKKQVSPFAITPGSGMEAIYLDESQVMEMAN